MIYGFVSHCSDTRSCSFTQQTSPLSLRNRISLTLKTGDADPACVTYVAHVSATSQARFGINSRCYLPLQQGSTLVNSFQVIWPQICAWFSGFTYCMLPSWVMREYCNSPPLKVFMRNAFLYKTFRRFALIIKCLCAFCKTTFFIFCSQALRGSWAMVLQAFKASLWTLAAFSLVFSPFLIPDHFQTSFSCFVR